MFPELHDAKVLIVEDNADNLFILIELLRTKAKVRYVNGRASGRQLFRLVESNPTLQPDLILLDLQIPHEDGYTVLRKIREHPLLQGTRVVAVTANIMPQDVERTRLAGFDGFIGKPVDRKRLADQLTRVLQGDSIWEPH
jgi:two-component system cell cycle response regulator DivK